MHEKAKQEKRKQNKTLAARNVGQKTSGDEKKQQNFY